jgi:hypothetical protein
VEIAGFLRRIKVEDPMEAPVAKKQLLDKNGKPIFEVLSLCSSKDKQLALTHENSTKICMAATEYTAELGSTGMDPEWNWASWSNYRGRIVVASEEQAKLANMSVTPGQQQLQLQQQQGKANFSIIKYLNRNQNTSSPGCMTKVTAIEGPTAIEAGIVSPVHGINPEELALGLPPTTNHNDSGSDSSSSERPTHQPARPRSITWKSAWARRRWTTKRPQTG